MMARTLDESIADLRAEPDPRRAVIAAYARMERALAAQGLARAQAEAPVEYLTRVLRRLKVSSGAVGSLTHLFERAKFSSHQVDAAMRTEAIGALVEVRDELKAMA
jgi:hypothetical protein